MRDGNQDELNKTLRNVGFMPIKLPDLHFGGGNKKTQKVYPSEGRPDTFFAGHGCYGGYVELKVSTTPTRFDFNQWSESQRLWYHTYAIPYRIPYWLFIQFGRDIRDKVNPKLQVLLSGDTLLKVEASSKKKSLSYEDVVSSQSFNILHWKGSGTWEIPVNHTFSQTYPIYEGKDNTNAVSVQR